MEEVLQLLSYHLIFSSMLVTITERPTEEILVLRRGGLLAKSESFFMEVTDISVYILLVKASHMVTSKFNRAAYIYSFPSGRDTSADTRIFSEQTTTVWIH